MDKEKIIAKVLTKLKAQLDAVNECYDELEKLLDDSSLQPDLISYTFEQVREILSKKAKEGYRTTIQTLITKHGGRLLSEVDPSEYESLVNDVHKYCTVITKEEVEKVASNLPDKILQDLLEYNYASSLDDLKPEYYVSFLWDARSL